MALDDTRNEKRTVRKEVMMLEDLDVVRISLVDRGANRVPFRLLKREKPEEGKRVLNFGLFKNQKAATGVRVAAVAVSPSADVTVATELIKRAGFSVEKTAKDESGAALFLQVEEKDLDPARCQTLKIDDTYAIVLVGADEVQKAASKNFRENLGAQQFIPGLYMAQDALQSSITTSLEEAVNKSDAAESIKASLNQYTEFINMLVEQIPEEVFKLETILDSDEGVQKSEGKTGTGSAAAPTDTENHPGTQTPATADGNVQKDDGKAGTATGTSNNDGKGQVQKSEPNKDPETNPILQAIAKMGEKLDTVIARVEKAEQSAEEAKVLAQKADGQASSTTVGVTPNSDPAPLRMLGRSVSKRSGPTPLLDTAYGSQD